LEQTSTLSHRDFRNSIVVLDYTLLTNPHSNRTVKNVRARARKHAAETLNAVSQSLCLPLRDAVKGYKSELRRLHPFEKVVADLTIRARQKKDGLILLDVLVRKEYSLNFVNATFKLTKFIG
jgi:hypothetical protein